MKMNCLLVLFAAGAMAIAPWAAAQQSERGWYLGAEAGQADFAGEHDTAFKVLGGYQINRHFAAEGAYAWLFDKNGAEATAFEVTALGFLPLAQRFSLFGRLGLANAYIEAPVLDSEKVQLTYGVGVQYDVSRAFAVRGQWQRYDTEEELDLLSVGVLWRF